MADAFHSVRRAAEGYGNKGHMSYVSDSATELDDIPQSRYSASQPHPSKYSEIPTPVTSGWPPTPGWDAAESDGLQDRDESTKALPPRSAPRRSIHFMTPTTAALLFLVAVILIIANHIWFASLNGKPPNNQKWTTRGALAMAYVVKINLSTAMSIALCQLVWYTVQTRRSGFTISGIDALFCMESNILQLFKWELWRLALPPVLMALCIWLTSFISIAAPSSLLVGLLTQNNATSCIVPTLNISLVTALSPGLQLWAAEAHGDVSGGSSSNAGLQASELPARIGLQSLWTSPCGANCSYDVTFVAPSWQCTSYDNILDPAQPWMNEKSFYQYQNLEDGAAFNSSNLFVPWWSATANFSQVTLEEGLRSGAGGIPYTYIANITENRIWIGYSAPSSANASTFQDHFNVTTFFCDFMNSSYHITVNYSNTVQTNTILNITHLNNITLFSNETSLEDDYLNAGFSSRGIIEPLIDLLSGFEIIERTGIDGTGIFSHVTLIPGFVNQSTTQPALDSQMYLVDNAMEALESISHNISISLMANKNLAIASNQSTTCYTSNTMIAWQYEPWVLWVTYGLGAGAAIICLVVGAIAMQLAGVARDKHFSTIMRTTRDAALQDLALGAENGAQPLRADLGRARLRFTTSTDTPGAATGFKLLHRS